MVRLPEFRPPVASIQNGELLAKREILKSRLGTRPQGGRSDSPPAERVASGGLPEGGVSCAEI